MCPGEEASNEARVCIPPASDRDPLTLGTPCGSPPEVDGFHSPDGIALSKRFLSLGARFPKPLLLLAFPVVANLHRLIHFEHRSGREAAAALGVTERTISQWLTGKRYPSGEMLARIDRTMGSARVTSTWTPSSSRSGSRIPSG